MREIKISPIFYMGCKKRLILDGLIYLFPQNIDNYYEPFAGSAIVAMNVKANNYYINDINPHLFGLYNMFIDNDTDTIITHINNRINQYGLPRIRTKRDVFLDIDKIEKYKSSYIAFRNYYNANPNILDFFTLNFFSYSQMFRFNVDNEYNMPFGSDCYTEMHNLYIKNAVSFFNRPNVHLSNISFDILLSDIDTNSFVYFDPPYLFTLAVYNESRDNNEFTWNEEWELKLRNLCDNLTERNIKWGMSNVFRNKDFYNESLINWVNENKYYTHHFTDHTYIACGKGNANTDEVYIGNYPLRRIGFIPKKLF